MVDVIDYRKRYFQAIKLLEAFDLEKFCDQECGMNHEANCTTVLYFKDIDDLINGRAKW